MAVIEIKVNQTYSRSSAPYDVIRVIDIIVKGGRCVIRCQQVYGDDPDLFSVGPEDTKEWQIF